MTHTLTVAALGLSFALLMLALVAVVTLTEPGAWQRYRDASAYHRDKAKHAQRRARTTTLTALTAARTA